MENRSTVGTNSEEALGRLSQRINSPVGRVWSRSTQKIERFASRLEKREYLAALIVLVRAFLCAWPVIRGLAKTSLWNDEIWSIENFSSKGPVFVATHYRNNHHVFFDLLNSPTPGESMYLPWRARMWSNLLFRARPEETKPAPR
jgi:hypothetical protein